jgi:hypothetical protein
MIKIFCFQYLLFAKLINKLLKEKYFITFFALMPIFCIFVKQKRNN